MFAALVTLPLITANAEQMTAIVRTPDGKPADKATVVTADTHSWVIIDNAKFVSTDKVLFRGETDSAGHVDLTPHDGDSWLVVVHPSGFARVKCASKTVPETIPLSPWVRIEGICGVARKSVSNHLVRLSSTLPPPPWIWSNGSATTDASGRFVIEGPMDAHASLIFEAEGDDFRKEKERTEPVSSTFISMILIAGQTRHVEFGATCRPVIGQLRHNADSKENAPWSSAMIVINPDIRGPAEGSISFIGRADRDGFSIHDVPPGRYLLDVRFSKRARDQLVRHDFSVPEIGEKLAQRPVDLGVLTLTPAVPRPARVMKAR